jgi:hypothetical protein
MFFCIYQTRAGTPLCRLLGIGVVQQLQQYKHIRSIHITDTINNITPFCVANGHEVFNALFPKSTNTTDSTIRIIYIITSHIL